MRGAPLSRQVVCITNRQLVTRSTSCDLKNATLMHGFVCWRRLSAVLSGDFRGASPFRLDKSAANRKHAAVTHAEQLLHYSRRLYHKAERVDGGMPRGQN